MHVYVCVCMHACMHSRRQCTVMSLHAVDAGVLCLCLSLLLHHSEPKEAAPVTGGLELELLALENTALPRGRPGGKSRSPKRKLVKHKRKTDKTKRKVARRRR